MAVASTGDLDIGMKPFVFVLNGHPNTDFAREGFIGCNIFASGFVAKYRPCVDLTSRLAIGSSLNLPAGLSHQRALTADLDFGSLDKLVSYMASVKLACIMVSACFEHPKMIPGAELKDLLGSRDRLIVIFSLLNVVALRFAFDIQSDLCILEETALVVFEIQVNDNDAYWFSLEVAIGYFVESALDAGLTDT